MTTVVRYRSRRALEKEQNVIRAVTTHPDLGEEVAEQLRRVFATGVQFFVGLTHAQVGLMHFLAARQNMLIPF